MDFRFSVLSQDSSTRARSGKLMLSRPSRGHPLIVDTPTFMPVGTKASVRTQSFDDLESTGAQILLANTYHLIQSPGPELLQKLGGLHGLTGWSGGFLTDSGGFQVFSLSELCRVDDDGVRFRPQPDSAEIVLSPEASIHAQRSIGADIMMAFDQCVPSTSDRAQVEQAMHRTHAWAKRSFEARKGSDQALFGIVQGALDKELRKVSALALQETPFDGFAIGGLAVGEGRPEREDTTEWTTQFMPLDKPRYLMGVGTPIDLLEAVARGVDMFDCILPQAIAQQGVAFTWGGKVDLRRSLYREQVRPLEEGCPCPTCRRHTRAYLRHLIESKEIGGWQLVATHNLHFYQRLMRAIREALSAGAFGEFYKNHRQVIGEMDREFPTKKVRRVHLPVAEDRGRTPSWGNYEVISTVAPESGAQVSRIRQKDSGETMHPSTHPIREAKFLYVESPRVLERSRARSGVIRVWDVGLGAATNAMALIDAWEKDPELPKLEIVSFEKDLDSLRLALKVSGRFPHLWHPGPKALLEKRLFESPRITWRLLEGDIQEKLDEAGEAPDWIFYDPFSTKTDGPLWSAPWFARLKAALGPQARTELITYSQSQAAREGMKAAGFFVQDAPGVGFKKQTTRAATYDPLA